jgi:[acyl-carrier-protein] S-malonyltransferase
MVRWPGRVTAGTVREDLVSFIDLPATTLAVAGVPVPKHFQGQIFLGPTAAPPRQFVYVHRDRMDQVSETIRAVRDRVPEPVAFAGHSLGQVTALIASGALPLDAGVRFAARRAELTQRAADSHPGKMAALLGATPEQASEACTAAPDAAWVANDNAPGQIVIAGTPDGVDAAGARAKELGVKRVTPLNVGGAFHTPLMRDAADALPSELESVSFSAPAAPVVSNHDAKSYDDGDGWRDRLPEHVTVPVRWRASMETMVGLGVTSFLEVGHGSMLAGLAKRTTPDVPVRGIATPEDVQALDAETELV